MEAGHAVHQVDESGEETSKGAGSGGGGEEEGDSETNLVSLVPLGEVERYTGEETGLGDTQEETGDEETFKVFHETHTGHDDTPADHDGGDPQRGSGGVSHRRCGGWVTHLHAFMTMLLGTSKRT